jgi:hypothetical protein
VHGLFGSASKVTSIQQTWAAPATVTDGVLDGQLLRDGLALSFDGLPPIPDVDALPGDSIVLLAEATEPAPQTTNGNVAFSVNGQEVSGCTAVPVALDGSVYEADCTYVFQNSGTYVLGAQYVGADGSLGSAQNEIPVATPDEAAIVDQECAEAATMAFTC